MPSQGIHTGIGLRHVRIGLRSADGIMAMPSDHVVGECWPGLHLSGAATLTLTPPEPERVTARGDDAVVHTFHMPPTEGWTAELTAVKQDMPVIELITGVIRESEPDFLEGIPMGTDREGLEADVVLWGQRMGADTDPESATYGATVWEAFELLNCKLTPLPASKEQSAIGEFRYAVTMQKASCRITGVLFTVADHGCTKATYWALLAYTGKVFYDFDQGNGTVTEFVLTHTPTAVDEIKVFVAGVDEPTGWSVNLATKTVTFTAAPADGDAICFLYTTDDTL